MTRVGLVLKDVRGYGLMGALSQLAGFLLLPVFTRVFTTADYGTIEIVLTATMLLSTFASLSLPSAVQRHFLDPNPGELASTALAFIAAFGTVLLTAGALASPWLAGRLLGDPAAADCILWGLVAAFAYALGTIPKVVLRMERRIGRLTVLNVGQTLLYAGLALWFVFVLDLGVRGVLAAAAAAGVAALAFGLMSMRRHLAAALSWPRLTEALRYSLPLVPVSTISWLNDQLDRLLLLGFLGLNAVGIFGAAARISGAVRLFSSAVQQSWDPHGIHAIGQPSQDRNRFYQQSLGYYAAVFASIGMALTAVGPELFRLVVAPEYVAGYVVVPWLVGALSVQGAAGIAGIGVIMARRTHINLAAALAGVTLNIGMAWVLIPRFGLAGGAIGRFLAALMFTGTLLTFSQRGSDVRFDNGALFRCVLLYIVGAAGLLWIAAAVPSPFGALARAALAAVIIAAILRELQFPVRQTLRRLSGRGRPGRQAVDHRLRSR